MTKTEKQILEQQFEDLWELIVEVDRMSERLRSRAEEALEVLGLPVEEGAADVRRAR